MFVSKYDSPPYELTHGTILLQVPSGTAGRILLYRTREQAPEREEQVEDLQRALWRHIGSFRYFDYRLRAQ